MRQPDASVLEHERTRVGGRDWHALVGGDPGAPPVVVLHGLGAGSEAQRPVARLLARRFRVLVPDLPGFGRSDPPSLALDIPGYADALTGWAIARNLPAAGFLGNSMGCQVLAHLAAGQPDRVRAVVLQAPTMDAAARTRTGQAARLAVDGLFERPSLGLVQARGVRRAGLRHLRATLDAALADHVEETVAGLRCPVLVVRGTRDPVVSQTWAETVASRAPRGVLNVVPGAPHAMVYSAPLELARVAGPFLVSPPRR